MTCPSFLLYSHFFSLIIVLDSIYMESLQPHLFTSKSFLILFWVLSDYLSKGFSGGASGKEPPCQCRKLKRHRFNPLGQEDPLEKNMAAHSSILVWKISWMEEPGGPQSIVSPRVGHNWNNLAHMWNDYLMGNESRKAGPGSSLWGLTEQLITHSLTGTNYDSLFI